MPFLFIFALGIGAFVMRRRSTGGRSASTGALPSYLDPDLPEALTQEVRRALKYEENPKSLSEFADSLSRTYPRAGYEIRVKAWIMGGRLGPVPQPPW
jgi:hypothetical protein